MLGFTFSTRRHLSIFLWRIKGKCKTGVLFDTGTRLARLDTERLLGDPVSGKATMAAAAVFTINCYI